MRRLIFALSFVLLTLSAAFGLTSPLEGHWFDATTSLDITVVGNEVTVSHPTATGRTKFNRGELRGPWNAIVETPQGPMIVWVEGYILTVETPHGKTLHLHR